jgi:hypothetical protein
MHIEQRVVSCDQEAAVALLQESPELENRYGVQANFGASLFCVGMPEY